ncbi:MAG: hypothetical protein ACYTBS_19065 [Planctomycetota bacterium]|jgi:hypothetical protein
MSHASCIRSWFQFVALIGIVLSYAGLSTANDKNADRIKPYAENPHYWQYKGKPVMLLGGSDDDNLFQWPSPDLERHLDAMQTVGANYVRNTMSDRRDKGFELYPFKRLENGQYDLDQWNDTYWQRFERFLAETSQRDIFVQIEVWDRFDYSQDNWVDHPYNPKNNTNYTAQESTMAVAYPAPAYRNQQPFFFTTPKQRDIWPVLKYQERFVRKLLSCSLRYGHVLYCMNNETSAEPQWGQHWIGLIKTQAADQGVTVYVTDMFDDAYMAEEAEHTRLIFNNANHYMFADISQVNSRNYDQTHWDRLQWLLRQVDKHPRPGNHTKIYGSGYYTFGTGGPEDGVERFWRNIIGGSASARFHRPDAGNGLNDFAKASIKAARILESLIKFWDITPQMDLLSDRKTNEAYLAAKPGESYALYFTDG